MLGDLLHRLKDLRINMPHPHQGSPACLDIFLVYLALNPFPAANHLFGNVFPHELLLPSKGNLWFRPNRQRMPCFLSTTSLLIPVSTSAILECLRTCNNQVLLRGTDHTGAATVKNHNIDQLPFRQGVALVFHVDGPCNLDRS